VDAGSSLPLDAAIALVHQLLDLAAHFEAAGTGWRPVPGDFLIDADARLHLSEARGAWRLEGAERFEIKRPLIALGTCLVPAPLVLGAPRLVRLLSAHHEPPTHRVISVADARLELARAERELALPDDDFATMAAITDQGLRRERNEDAVEIASGVARDGGRFFALVVCDGIARSTRAKAAASAAARTARAALERFAEEGDARTANAMVADAIHEAHRAVCSQRFHPGRGEPPGTTIVCALVHRNRLVVGWVGDSRAYWVTGDGATQLTRDHSWIHDVVASGAMSEADALRHPLAHALTRCLGPIEGPGASEIEPDVVTHSLRGSGHVVLCSDGLWTYYRDAVALGRLVGDAGPRANAARIARYLVNNALVRGGGDNVSVAIYAHARG